MVSFRNVWGVYVIEDTDDDVLFYCIGIFKSNEDAESMKYLLYNDIDNNIDEIEENGEEFFTVSHCSDENLKNYLERADLKDGIMVRNCNFKIFVSKEVYYQ